MVSQWSDRTGVSHPAERLIKMSTESGLLHMIRLGKSNSSSVMGTKNVFLELITRKTGDNKVKAKLIVNLLRNFCSFKSSVNRGPKLHNYYLHFFYCHKSERGCGILNLISFIVMNVIM